MIISTCLFFLEQRIIGVSCVICFQVAGMFADRTCGYFSIPMRNCYFHIKNSSFFSIDKSNAAVQMCELIWFILMLDAECVFAFM